MSFPALQPTARSLTYGQYPVKSYTAMNGAVTRRLFGDRASGFKLQLTFSGLDAESLDSLWTHYDEMQGGYTGFTLPDSVWAGEAADLRTRYQTLTGILWHYESPPQVEAQRGTTRRNVTLTLTGDQTGG